MVKAKPDTDKNYDPKPEEIKDAWTYYQHADNLQHQRHNIFILAQTILFGAFLAFAQQAPTLAKVAVALLGSVYALMWYLLAERLSDGMSKLSRKYLEKSPIYSDYLASLSGIFHRRTILNVFIPAVTFVVWFVLLLVNLTRLK